MKFSEYIQNLREKYKQKEAHKTTIELMYITRAIRKGSVKNG